jgi:hypothetical protein
VRGDFPSHDHHCFPKAAPGCSRHSSLRVSQLPAPDRTARCSHTQPPCSTHAHAARPGLTARHVSPHCPAAAPSKIEAMADATSARSEEVRGAWQRRHNPLWSRGSNCHALAARRARHLAAALCMCAAPGPPMQLLGPGMCCEAIQSLQQRSCGAHARPRSDPQPRTNRKTHTQRAVRAAAVPASISSKSREELEQLALKLLAKARLQDKRIAGVGAGCVCVGGCGHMLQLGHACSRHLPTPPAHRCTGCGHARRADVSSQRIPSIVRQRCAQQQRGACRHTAAAAGGGRGARRSSGAGSCRHSGPGGHAAAAAGRGTAAF